MAAYLRPSSLDEALSALGDGAWTIIAGGTDYYPARVGLPLDDDILDISALSGLRSIRNDGGQWRIPALATWTDIQTADLPAWFDGLKAAAREVGGAQIQNAGTLCGNLCNASPAADGMPVLLSLDAEVELSSRAGIEVLPLAAFVQGNRRTALREDQLVSAVLIPAPGASKEGGRAGGCFLKLGARRYMVISISMVAAALEVDAVGLVTRAAVAVGACSEVAQRLPGLEAELIGKPVGAALGDAVLAEHFASLTPIADPRGTADYRLESAATLCRRALTQLGEAL
ncbi:MAG: xanthine dehydrogenase family protein subunit M [Alphaproteobacteria bacterium]|jgi:CO/xanthine dehydrogenase FAD-binding subunit|nr:xanthine dehydrogenase family protein subunit M [Alphaproteobacteria bacterium]